MAQYFNQVYLDGLPGRKKPFRATFSPGLNILWGMNGSGKTTLLKVLHSAFTTDTAPLLRLSFSAASVSTSSDEKSFVRELRRSGSSREVVELDDQNDFDNLRDFELARLKLLEATQALHWVSTGDNSSSDKLRHIPHRYLPVSRIFDFRNRFGRRTGRGAIGEVLDEVEYDRVFAEQIQALWSEFHANALAHTRFAQQEAINQILGSVLSGGLNFSDENIDIVPAGDARRLVTAFLQSHKGLGRHVQADAILSEYESNSLLNRVVGTITRVQERIEVSLEPERRFQEVLNNLLSRKRVEIDGPRYLNVISDRGEDIPIASLSSGEKQLMRLLLETLSAGDTPVLVDEPEISLHVDWQSQLLNAMTYINPKAQLIIATHSPEIVGNGSNAKVIEV